MKQVKTVLVAIVLLIGISIPQSTNAQQQDQLSINLVGKWINENSDKQILEFHADGTYTSRDDSGKKFRIEGTDITYPVKTLIYHYTWKVEGKILTKIQVPKIDYILGDISYYPADIQKRIKEDIESGLKVEDEDIDTLSYIISSFSPESFSYKKIEGGKDTWTFVRDMSNILQPYKLSAIQNKDKGLAYDIAYAYENGGMHQLYMGAYDRSGQEVNFVQNDDSAMVWYKKCVAYGNDPTKSDKPNLYKAYKRIEQLRRIIEKTKKFLPKYTKKYGQSAGTSLYKGRFNGLSFAAVNEFVRDLNSVENKYVLKAYEPTVSDVIKYGRGVKNYTLFSTGTFAINLTEIKVLNGKVIAQRNDYYGGMEQVISSYKESLDIYRDEGWIRRLDRINNK